MLGTSETGKDVKKDSDSASGTEKKLNTKLLVQEIMCIAYNTSCGGQLDLLGSEKWLANNSAEYYNKKVTRARGKPPKKI
jgi:hypothetical protein